jgi:hypothetical protein
MRAEDSLTTGDKVSKVWQQPSFQIRATAFKGAQRNALRHQEIGPRSQGIGTYINKNASGVVNYREHYRCGERDS